MTHDDIGNRISIAPGATLSVKVRKGLRQQVGRVIRDGFLSKMICKYSDVSFALHIWYARQPEMILMYTRC